MTGTVAYICQGCGVMMGANVPDSFHERGMVNKKFYCEKCVVVVDEYLKDRDDLHSELAITWRDALAILRKESTERGIKNLPDGG